MERCRERESERERKGGRESAIETDRDRHGQTDRQR